MQNVKSLLNHITTSLTEFYDLREAHSIALLTLSELSGISSSKLLSDPAAPLEIEGLEAVIAELVAGRPVQYVLGSAEFCGRRFAVREGVLIPRPETEELVAWILHEERASHRLLDVGTGSGCLQFLTGQRLTVSTWRFVSLRRWTICSVGTVHIWVSIPL